ncbi:hypothetical protein B0H14DRAFT_3726371, partial [Mycena olivaceomarginata]
YGSGYPSLRGDVVSQRDFPFHYWPVVWYDYDSGQTSHDPSRPCGPLRTMFFKFNATSITYSTFQILADNATVLALMVSIAAKCSNHDLVQHPDTPGNFSPPTSGPAPQEVQYYRASSVALTLDGYNNTAYFLNSTDDTPLPESVDKEFLACLTFTIGAAVPLVDA